MAAESISSLPGRGIKPLVSLMAHRRLALLVFALVVLAGFPISFLKGKPQYSATAMIQVAPRYMKNLRDEGELDLPSNTQYREFLEQQVQSVTRFDIVRDALRKLGDKAAPWRLPNESERLFVDRIRGKIAASAIQDTYMIEISMQADKKDGLADIINAVVEVFVDRMREERIFGADVRVRNLEKRESEVAQTILEKTKQRTEITVKLGLSGFKGNEQNPYDKILSDLHTSLADARSKRFDAESRLNAFVKNGETDLGTRSVQEAVSLDSGLVNLKANLYKRRADLLVEQAGLQPNHPAYQGINEELRKIDEEIAGQTKRLNEKMQSSVLSRYRTGVEQAKQVEDSLEAELANQEKRGGEYATLYNQATTLTMDIDEQRKELEAIRDRLNQFASEKNSFGFVRMVTPALPPELPFGPGKTKIMLMALIAAFFLAIAVPVLVDLADKRIHTVNDAEKILGIPAIGWMIESQDTPTSLLGDDLYRRLAASLIRQRENHDDSVFAFTAVKPGAGTSELVLKLAKALDLMGYPALAVDANAFKPDDRYAVAPAGLTDCLSMRADDKEYLHNADDKLPARIGIGTLPAVRHIDHIDRIGEFSKTWLKSYRFVLVDIPPLLLSADSEFLAHHLRNVFLVVQSGVNTKGELKRVGRHLEKVDPASVGLIVNRIRPFQGGGYLKELMIEFSSARNLGEYFTTPAWSLLLRAQLMGLRKKFF